VRGAESLDAPSSRDHTERSPLDPIQESYAVDEDTWRVVGAEVSPTAVNWEPVVVISCANVES